jgi:uncharacterized membrane protein
MLPLSLSQGAGLTADSFTMAIAFLTMAFFLRLAYGPEPAITSRQVAILGALYLLLALSKQAYFLLVLLYFLIPTSRFGSRKRYWFVFSGLLTSGAIALGIWGALTTPLLVRWVGEVDPYAQAHFVFANPIRFLRIAITTIMREQSMAKLFGRTGWEDVQLPEVLVWLHLTAILLAALQEKSETVLLRTRERAVLLSTFALSVLLLAFLLYMQWNPVGNGAVRGLQRGRYYLPLLPLPFLGVWGIRARASRWVPASGAAHRLGHGSPVQAILPAVGLSSPDAETAPQQTDKVARCRPKHSQVMDSDGRVHVIDHDSGNQGRNAPQQRSAAEHEQARPATAQKCARCQEADSGHFLG